MCDNCHCTKAGDAVVPQSDDQRSTRVPLAIGKTEPSGAQGGARPYQRAGAPVGRRAPRQIAPSVVRHQPQMGCAVCVGRAHGPDRGGPGMWLRRLACAVAVCAALSSLVVVLKGSLPPPRSHTLQLQPLGAPTSSPSPAGATQTLQPQVTRTPASRGAATTLTSQCVTTQRSSPPPCVTRPCYSTYICARCWAIAWQRCHRVCSLHTQFGRGAPPRPCSKASPAFPPGPRPPVQYFGGIELQWFQGESSDVWRYLPLEALAVRAG
jgi:hypothetical protein